MSATDERLSVAVRGLHVRYEVVEDRQSTAFEFLRRGVSLRRATEVHALRGIDLDIHVGEAVGIVGANGSGKSTLLRCVAGVQGISEGRVCSFEARPRQLLGVRAALESKLSGWRNVWLGGLALGLTSDEVASAVEDVRAFSGLGDALDRPLATYSSGIRARLAFSIATMRVPDVLLIDEALAVGDRQFRKRSLQRVREICDNASTVLMVTHNVGEIKATCPRTIWIEDGVVAADGPTDEVLDAYAASDDA